MSNPNHPKRGSRIKVEPIRNLKDIKTIKELLKDNPRDLAIFTLGVNTNLRGSDLLNLRAGQVRGLKPMQDFEVRERKTGKLRRITLNEACIKVIRDLLASREYRDEDYLFKSQRGPVLTVPSLTRLVKSWCKMINLKGNYGSHTLRKTWGYQMRVEHNVGIPVLMECFNHSTQKQTHSYLCIQPDEIKSVFAIQL
jgi:integrase